MAAQVAEELETVTYATPTMEECRKKKTNYNYSVDCGYLYDADVRDPFVSVHGDLSHSRHPLLHRVRDVGHHWNQHSKQR